MQPFNLQDKKNDPSLLYTLFLLLFGTFSAVPCTFTFVLIIAVDPPVIDIQPMNRLNFPEGEDALFNVSVTGEMLEYQWQKDGVNISDVVGTYSGTNSATLTVQSVGDPDEGFFRVVVYNPANTDGVASTNAELSVCKCLEFIVL